jgi:hypothetical protein
MEEQPPIWKAAVNILKKVCTADTGWSSSLGVGRGANNTSPLKGIMFKKALDLDGSFGMNDAMKKGYEVQYLEC